MAYIVNKYILGVLVPILLIGAGVYFTLYLKGFHVLRPMRLIKQLMTKKEPGDVSPFRALTLALAGTLGVGNIVGVSAAIVLGGFGSIFWMWISALCAMILKYAEVVLAMNHRRSDKNGQLHGSAMYYINDIFANIKLRRTGFVLSLIFATLCILNAVSMGGMIQSNAVTDAVTNALDIPPLILGAIISLLCFFVISKGSKAISGFTEILVPIMSVGYVILSLAAIIIRIDMLPEALCAIVKDAFTPSSAIGGTVGFFLSDTLRYGCTRGLISNEAGCGTAPMAHCSTTSRNAALQGIYGIVEVFVDTIVLCTMTALVVIINYNELDEGQSFLMLTFDAYANTLGSFAYVFLTVAVVCFGFATILCFGHYGIETANYFSTKKKYKTLFTVGYSASVFLGACFSAEFIWNIADIAIGTMTVINVFAILIARKEIKKETEIFIIESKNSKRIKKIKNIQKKC